MIARDVLRFGDFVLKSGRRSPYFFNLGAVADAEGLAVLGTAYAAEALALPTPPEVLFGPAYKGIPIAVATVGAMLREHGRNVGAAFNRKEAKQHGEGGSLVGAALAGRKVAIVDDVVTDGAAKREAFEAVSEAGGHVVGIVLALDRREAVAQGSSETAVEALGRTLGVPVRSLATLDDVLAYLAQSPELAPQYERLAAHSPLGERAP
jgi:orotate phosphoribosyltransferase